MRNDPAHGWSERRSETTSAATPISISRISGLVVNDAATASPSAHSHQATGCRSRGSRAVEVTASVDLRRRTTATPPTAPKSTTITAGATQAGRPPSGSAGSAEVGSAASVGPSDRATRDWPRRTADVAEAVGFADGPPTSTGSLSGFARAARLGLADAVGESVGERVAVGAAGRRGRVRADGRGVGELRRLGGRRGGRPGSGVAVGCGVGATPGADRVALPFHENATYPPSGTAASPRRRSA